MPIEQEVVDFPTLGLLCASWVKWHCVVPSGAQYNQPFVMRGWQLWNACKFYELDRHVTFNPEFPEQGAAFRYRRAQIVGTQKIGKSPFGAALACFEAVGPCIFAGWAKGGEVFRCADHGCSCGFTYRYSKGEPMGMQRKVSLVQLVANSIDQTANIYRPIQTMARNGRLGDLMAVREGFVRLPNNGRIEPVTSNAKSKLGNPVNFALFDESGLYTNTNGMFHVADTISRGAAGMDGRSIELTNPWDPHDASFAQSTYESRVSDIWKFYRKHDPHLDFMNLDDRKKIIAYEYAGAPWVNLKNILGECNELLERDPAQARRFYGGELVQGLGSYLTLAEWDDTENDLPEPAQGTPVCLGFDGSRSGDWSALRAETVDGYRFTPTYGPDHRPTFWNPDAWGGRVPRGEIDAAVDELFRRYKVGRFYCDPHLWETQIDDWSLIHGDDVVVQWPTNQISRMYDALVRFKTDIDDHVTTHSKDADAQFCALNARKIAKPGDKYILGKPSEHQKIDILMADILAHEAASDMRAAGWESQNNYKVIFFN